MSHHVRWRHSMLADVTRSLASHHVCWRHIILADVTSLYLQCITSCSMMYSSNLQFIWTVHPQLTLFLLLGVMEYFGVDSLTINFTAGHMDHWCYVEPLQHNFSYVSPTVQVIASDDSHSIQSNDKTCRYTRTEIYTKHKHRAMIFNRSDSNFMSILSVPAMHSSSTLPSRMTKTTATSTASVTSSTKIGIATVKRSSSHGYG